MQKELTWFNLEETEKDLQIESFEELGVVYRTFCLIQKKNPVLKLVKFGSLNSLVQNKAPSGIEALISCSP